MLLCCIIVGRHAAVMTGAVSGGNGGLSEHHPPLILSGMCLVRGVGREFGMNALSSHYSLSLPGVLFFSGCRLSVNAGFHGLLVVAGAGIFKHLAGITRHSSSDPTVLHTKRNECDFLLMRSDISTEKVAPFIVINCASITEVEPLRSLMMQTC